MRRVTLLVILFSLLTACSVAPAAIAPPPTATIPPPTATPDPPPTTAPDPPTPRPRTATPVPSPTPNPDVRSFSNGHTVSGVFRRFWEANGGATAFGTPLTEAILVDGRPTQWFALARFALMSDTVALGLLGTEQWGIAPPVPSRADCRFFAETGHNLCAPFRDWWERNGGLARLGLPIAEAETTATGATQRFERVQILQNGATFQLAALGDGALTRFPGGALLRPATARAAAQPLELTPPAAPVTPLGLARLSIAVPGYRGAATLTLADQRGTLHTLPFSLPNGAATVDVPVRGALGHHAAIVQLGPAIAGIVTAAYKVDAELSITTGQPRFDRLLPMVKGFMLQDISTYTWGENKVSGYRSPDSNLLWLRDHVHQGKGYAYWESDMRSLLEQYVRFQRPNGEFDDYMANFPWGEVRGRTEVEADNEYLFIEGVYRAWQATGDDAWLQAQIAAMEQGLSYIRLPHRWDSERQMVKRPFTVDTWDFEYGPPTIAPDGKIAPRHWIDENTKWSIFHGDNSGYVQAMRLLAHMHAHLGNDERAAYWRSEADGLNQRLIKYLWLGKYFRHMLHLVPVDVPGVNEEAQLSLSNAYALNRGVFNQDEAAAVIEEYQWRYQNRGDAFAEWWSIDPPFPSGSLSTADGWGRNAGEYVNGGIMPLVGGELARGAFSHGYEAYGFDILQRYYSLIDGTGASYLWYYPVGLPGVSGPDTLPTDGWGSSAMLAALIEGAAGVRDDATLFRQATIAPRWPAVDDVDAATVVVRYGASDGYIAYRWQRTTTGVALTWTGSGDTVKLHLLLPAGVPATLRAAVDGKAVPVTIITIGGSRYADLDGAGSGILTLDW